MRLHGRWIGSSGGLLLKCSDFSLDIGTFAKTVGDDPPEDPISLDSDGKNLVYVFRWNVKEFGENLGFGSMDWDRVEDAAVNRLWFLVMKAWIVDRDRRVTLDAVDLDEQRRCVHALLLIAFVIDKMEWYIERETEMLRDRLESMGRPFLSEKCREEGLETFPPTKPGSVVVEALCSEQERRMTAVWEVLKNDGDGFKETMMGVLLGDSNVIERCYGVFREYDDWLSKDSSSSSSSQKRKKRKTTMME